MKRFLTYLILIISILSILVIPSFAATTSDTDEIVILKQPVDLLLSRNPDGTVSVDLSVVAIGSNLSYQWQRSYDLVSWSNINNSTAKTPNLSANLRPDLCVRCRISSGSNILFSRIVTVDASPANLFLFIKSCLRYITSYISLIINSLVTPGAPLYALLPVLCIGIAVAALLIVIKIIKGFSWGT